MDAIYLAIHIWNNVLTFIELLPLVLREGFLFKGIQKFRNLLGGPKVASFEA